MRMTLRLRNLAREDGQALAEYGLILAMVAVVCIVALTAFGLGVSGLFDPLINFFGPGS